MDRVPLPERKTDVWCPGCPCMGEKEANDESDPTSWEQLELLKRTHPNLRADRPAADTALWPAPSFRPKGRSLGWSASRKAHIVSIPLCGCWRLPSTKAASTGDHVGQPILVSIGKAREAKENLPWPELGEGRGGKTLNLSNLSPPWKTAGANRPTKLNLERAEFRPEFDNNSRNTLELKEGPPLVPSQPQRNHNTIQPLPWYLPNTFSVHTSVP